MVAMSKYILWDIMHVLRKEQSVPYLERSAMQAIGLTFIFRRVQTVRSLRRMNVNHVARLEAL